jgi:hypothetical protein
MAKQGGGVTIHEGVKVYVDLIVGDLSSIESDYPQTAELFAAFAKYRQGPSNFGFAEIDKDDRLYNALSKTEKGSIFYKKIRQSIPLITVSNKIVGDVSNIDNVRIFKLQELEKDPLGILNNMHKDVYTDTDEEESNFLDGIERLNKILSIKPGFFGLSININHIIDEWIKRKRASMLPKFKGKII